MEEVFADAAISAEAVEEVFGSLFPGLKPFQWFITTGEYPAGFSLDDPTHILFEISHEPERLAFHWRLSSYHAPTEGCEERQHIIARQLAIKLATRTLVSYQLPEEPKDPYYNLVFDSDTGYLADDSMFSWTGEVDEPLAPIKILRPVELPGVSFDSLGRLITEKSA